MSFGKNLERIRKGKKVSQTKLGEVLGITQQMISSYEKDASSPNIETLVKIADYFNVSIDALTDHEIQLPEEGSREARFLQYFEALSEIEQEKCITIAQTLFHSK